MSDDWDVTWHEKRDRRRDWKIVVIIILALIAWTALGTWAFWTIAVEAWT